MQDNHNSRTTIHISPKTILMIILFGLLIFLFIRLWDLVLVLLTSVVIASFVDYVATKFTAIKFPRVLSVVLIYILSFGVLTGVFYVFIPMLLGELSGLSELVSKYGASIPFFKNLDQESISSAKTIISHLNVSSISGLVSSSKDLISNLSSGLISTFSTAFGGILNVILIVVFSFYLSVQEKGIQTFLKIVTPEKDEDYIIGLWQRTEKKIALWVQGQFILGLIIGILVFLGTTIIGVKYSLSLAILAAFFELIPFGLILAVVPGIYFAYTTGGITLALITTGFYVIVGQFENYLIAPLVVKRVTGVPPIIVLLSLIIGFELAGFLGVILAVPCAVLLLEILNDVEEKKFLRRKNEQ